MNREVGAGRTSAPHSCVREPWEGRHEGGFILPIPLIVDSLNSIRGQCEVKHEEAASWMLKFR